MLETAVDIDRGRVHCEEILCAETGALLQEADLSEDSTLQVLILICCCTFICFGCRGRNEEAVAAGVGCGEWSRGAEARRGQVCKSAQSVLNGRHGHFGGGAKLNYRCSSWIAFHLLDLNPRSRPGRIRNEQELLDAMWLHHAPHFLFATSSDSSQKSARVYVDVFTLTHSKQVNGSAMLDYQKQSVVSTHYSRAPRILFFGKLGSTDDAL